MSFSTIYRVSRQRTLLGVSFPVRRTSFRDLVAFQEIIERASRQGTSFGIGELHWDTRYRVKYSTIELVDMGLL